MEEKKKKKKKKKKQDETGHFSNGIQCAGIAVSPFVSVPCFRSCTTKQYFDLK